MLAIKRQSEAVREALRAHPVVVLLGARGTGKSEVANSVGAQLESTGVQVVRIDAALAEDSFALNEPLAACLRCSPSDLSVEGMEPEDVARAIFENCQEFH